MDIKFNIPSASQLFGNNKIQNPNNVSRAIIEGRNAIPGSDKEIKEEDILTYFYHHFAGQAKIAYTAESNLPKAEIDINLSIEILFQTLKGKSDPPKSLEEMAQELSEEDGFFGAEAASNRLYETAKTISGDDPKQLRQIKSVIQNGFTKAESIAGELPELSHQTLKSTINKIDTHLNNVSAASIDIKA